MFIAAGTSLQVFPVADLVPVAKDAVARVIIANAEPTGMDALADIVINRPLGEVLPALCGVRR